MSEVKKIGKYEVVSVMGRGAMGVIYRANDTMLGRQVAIKTLSGVLPEDSELRVRFMLEARSVGRLQHPNVVTVHEFFEEAGTAYMVMELLEGASLFWLLRKEKPFRLEEKLSVLLQVAAGVQAAHENSIVHRDLKPSNVFIERKGAVKILDFGVAKVGESGLTRAGTIFGTIEYMAPEQLRAEPVDARADVFSVGVLAYELISGRNPFRAETPAASVFKLVSDDPESLTSAAGVAAALDGVVKRAISKKRDDRFPSMTEFASALKQAAADLGVSPQPRALAEDEVATKSGVIDSTLGGEAHQWSHIAAAVGQLERLYREGIERFSSGDYEGAVERMSQVLDEAQVHSLALHYLTQAEEKLRHKRLDANRRREVAGLLAFMRRAHQQGDSSKVVETVTKVLAIDPESMEARWYRRTAENRLTPSRTRHASLSQAGSLRTGMRKKEDVIAIESLPVSTPSSSFAYWYAAAAAALLLGVLGFAWVFSGSGKAHSTAAAQRSGSKPVAGVRVSVFDGVEDGSTVDLVLPANLAPPTITGAYPQEITRGEESDVVVTGKNFHPAAKVVLITKTESAAGAEIVSSTVTNASVIQARLRVSPDAPEGESLVLAVQQPNGNRSAEFQVSTK